MLTPLHGYQIPDELVGTHYEGIVSGALDEVTPAWMVLNEVAPVAAQYCVPMAMKFRYSVHTNLRQLSHLVELRSTIQGHRDYRAIAHDITRQLRAVHPTIGALATEFVDFSEVDLPRLQSELRAEQKRRLIATDSAA